jgi:ribosomal protein S12 methylthiotransferase
MPDQVPAEVAQERLARVSELQERLADEAARRFVGRQLEVTVQEVVDAEGGWADAAEPQLTIARSYREAPDTDGEIQLVGADGHPVDLPVGRTVSATVVDAVGVDLVARVDAASAGGSRG